MSGRVLGAVLVGGASSRFGSDKAAALWGGTALADHAADAIAPFAAAVVRVGGGGGIPDLPQAGLGPLGGIAAALDHAGRHGFDTVLTIACDMPRLPEGLVEALVRRAPACCLDAPVLGHWPAALAGELIARLAHADPSPRPCVGLHGPACLQADERAATWRPGQARHDDGGQRHRRSGALSIRRWAGDIGALPIVAPAPLVNVNTPADLLAL